MGENVIKGACEPGVALGQEVEIDGGRFYGRMAKKLLEGVEVRTMVEHMGGKGMPEDMQPPSSDNTGFLFCPHKDLMNSSRADMVIAAPSREQPFAGLISMPVFPELRQKSPGENSVAVLSPLALLNSDHHSGGIALDMLRPEPNDLTETQTCAIGGFEQNPVF